MSEPLSVAVIGCGVFGAMTALRLAERGASVVVFERQAGALRGSSLNNQNRLHLGFHYPRDDETARQCIRGFTRFREEFKDCVLDGFPNAYFIAQDGSLTTPQSYLDFCDRVGLRYDVLDPAAFTPPVEGVDLALSCDEVVYDCHKLRELIEHKLDASGVERRFGAAVTAIERANPGFVLAVAGQGTQHFDAVINCTYADVNQFTASLGHATPRRQYEYTLVPILEWDQSPVGITIMDGRFMTILPFGRSGRFLLYDVGRTVLDTHVGDQMPAGWLDPHTSPSSRCDPQAVFEDMLAACAQFVPALASARLVGFLEGPRVVLAQGERTDARPSIVQHHEPGYVSVFSGKIDHCVWVADEIADLVCADDVAVT